MMFLPLMALARFAWVFAADIQQFTLHAWEYLIYRHIIYGAYTRPVVLSWHIVSCTAYVPFPHLAVHVQPASVHRSTGEPWATDLLGRDDHDLDHDLWPVPSDTIQLY